MEIIAYNSKQVTWIPENTLYGGGYDKEKNCWGDIKITLMLTDHHGHLLDEVGILHIYQGRTIQIVDINPSYKDDLEHAGYMENANHMLPQDLVEKANGDEKPIVLSVINDINKVIDKTTKYTPEELYQIIIDHYGVSNTPEDDAGATWLLPDGKFLQLGSVSPSEYTRWNYPYHFEVDKWLEVKMNIDINKYNNGIMSDVYKALRINRGINGNEDCYIQLNSERPTSAQQSSLLDWMWICYDEGEHEEVEVDTPTQTGYFYFNEEDPPKILRAINRYYNTGELV